MSEVVLNSWEDLQKAVTKITIALNNDENLKLAAAVNPLLALAELCYRINPDILDKVEDRLRFGPETAAKLDELRSTIHREAGGAFDIRSERDLNRVLFDELNIEAFDHKGCPVCEPVRPRRKGEADDTLNTYAGLHPVIGPLLAFREIDASVAAFGDRFAYDQIRQGKYGKDSNIHLHIKLKKRKSN
ncbi:hypothetical protein [Dyadobacter sp. Leaf189]|uniref:hypothetical protein n=1 Tax=Dyadobacter sp. Leaf189 TaxID=1736295 RepID=UPI0006F590C1|nr:hypothetical protein [Dyadobacter sp. Leaf189]KQS27065.1 hypothetical protein ASG33_21265 [Dyadobacter sp. Leaf189]